MKDARYFKHDANARNDPKTKALINKLGLEGYGRFWVLIEVLRESSHYRIEDKPYVWECLAEEFKCDIKSAKEFVEMCTDIYELLEREDGFYYSTSLLARMMQLEEIREKRRMAAYKRYESDES